MFNSYFYLNRTIYELAPFIRDKKAGEVFSQEKDVLFINAACEDMPFAHILIAANPQSPSLRIKPDHRKAKRNIVSFFPGITGKTFDNVEIAMADRIIRFSLGSERLYFFIRGRDTNIIYDNTIELQSFKKAEKTRLRELVTEAESFSYTNQIFIPDFPEFSGSGENFSSFRKEYRFITREIYHELIRRKSQQAEPYKEILKDLLEMVYHEAILTGFDKEENKKYFGPPFDYKQKTLEDSRFSENCNEALSAFTALGFRNNKKLEYKNKIEKYLYRELEKSNLKIDNLNKRVSKGSREKVYSHYGAILLANLHLLRKGLEEIKLNDYISNEEITIKLKAELSPSEQVDRYFEKGRDEKKNFEISSELLESARERHLKLVGVKNRFEAEDSLENYRETAKILHLEKDNSKVLKMEVTAKYRKYLLSDKYEILVGKDSKSNDLLTTKIARQNDYWMHARGMPGSHVVLRTDNPKETMPKNILKAAASLAAYHSKAKTAGTVPVSYTLAKFVYKRKGMPPGQVQLSKEKVLLVKPEIPADCEEIHEENL